MVRIMEDGHISCSQRLRNWKRIVSFLAINAAYVLIGTFSFEALESDFEQKMCNASRETLEHYEVNFATDDAGNYVISPEKLREFLKESEYYAQEGVPMTQILEEGCPNFWTLGGSAYFCGTIVTTVGYGDNAPKTVPGRVFFMLYVIPGIAICGALLAELGVLIYNMSLRQKASLKHSPLKIGGPLFWIIHSLICFGFFLFVPAGIIYALEGEWNYFECIYFMMVTFSTVGFGDLTITSHDWKFLIMFISYVGLAWVGVIAGVITEKIQKMNKVSRENESHRSSLISDKIDCKSISSIILTEERADL